jgi:carbamoyltransferase
MAGGVALNCSANGKLMRSGLFDEIYVQPAAGDDGSALGAALYRASLSQEVVNIRFPVPFLGPHHSNSEVEAALSEFKDHISVEGFSDQCHRK